MIRYTVSHSQAAEERNQAQILEVKESWAKVQSKTLTKEMEDQWSLLNVLTAGKIFPLIRI